MSRRRKKKVNYNLVLVLLIISLLFTAFLFFTYGNSDVIEKTLSRFNETSSEVSSEEVKQVVSGNLNIYYLDVGQADSILISIDNKYALIDAGNNEDGKKLVNYFNTLGITEFEYVIGTHPHEDHIGGLDDIINNFSIKHFYMPDAITTSKTFEDVLDALNNKQVKLETPKINDTFNLSEGTFKVIYTGTDTSDLNDTSIVLKLTYGSTSYLFTGDATSKTEKQILNSDIQADVLKVGHHGSQYSSTNDFLDKVNPKYAIISVGLNNTYKHPKAATLEKLNARNITIYRTDEKGTILLHSDGTSYEFSFLKTDTNG